MMMMMMMMMMMIINSIGESFLRWLTYSLGNSLSNDCWLNRLNLSPFEVD